MGEMLDGYLIYSHLNNNFNISGLPMHLYDCQKDSIGLRGKMQEFTLVNYEIITQNCDRSCWAVALFTRVQDIQLNECPDAPKNRNIPGTGRCGGCAGCWQRPRNSRQQRDERSNKKKSEESRTA